MQWFPVIEFAFFLSEQSVLLLECMHLPLAASCPFQWRLAVFLCVPAGNTLCKSGSIAVFGNVVYSGLLNDHLWHLGVPLFTRLVRAAGPSVHTYLHFVGRVSCSSVEPKQTLGAEFPKVSNGLLLMRALLTCVEVILSIQDVTVVCCGYKTREPLHISASYFISDF